MTAPSRLVLHWAPRALSIAFAAFISMFALDVFSEGRGVWQTVVALMIHLIPTYVLVGMLILAWRWEWIGAAVSSGLGFLFLWWDHNYRHNAGIAVLMIAGPLFLMAALYLVNWLKRDQLHTRP
jgi:hypothetical protein